MHVVAIIAAAGRGERLGGEVPKQLRSIDGRTLLQCSKEAFDACELVDDIIIVGPREVVEAPASYLKGSLENVLVIEGGVRRQDSVALGFDRVTREADIVVVHDAARPFVSAAMIARTIEAAFESGAAVAAVASPDTVKDADPRTLPPVVRATLPRESIFLAQTPQAFRYDVLRAAVELGRSGVDATDEAMLAERAGYQVRLVEGDPRNIKITTPSDLALAKTLLGSKEKSSELRVGTGYDLHRLIESRRLVLAGIEIPFDRGLFGHSDADVLCHAIIDALLGAARLGDIGRHFPNTDERWKDAFGLDLLSRTERLVQDAGYEIQNIDAVVIAERPAIAPYAERMCAALAQAMSIDANRVSVKGKTQEGLGEIGRGEAIAAHAVALLKKG